MDATMNVELKRITKSAIRESLSLISEAHAGEALCGYALCTDDDIRTLYQVACTEEFCAASKYESTRFIPTEWQYSEGRSLFDEAQALLRASATAASGDDEKWDAHIAGSFAALAAALGELKAEGLFADDVLLIVTSTDPGPDMERRAIDCAATLNSVRLFEEWKAEMFP